MLRVTIYVLVLALFPPQLDSTKSSTSTLNLNQLSSTASVGDPWAICLFGFMERERVLQQCPAAVAQAWPICYQRVTTLFNVIDPT